MSGQKLGLKQKLQFKLSPQQIQLMKLLQLSVADLNQRVQEELESNPILEEENYDNQSEEVSDTGNDEIEYDDYLNEYLEDDPVTYKMTADVGTREEEEKQLPIALKESLFDKLKVQLLDLELETEEEQLIAAQVMGSIDEDGYIRRDLLAIQDDLLFMHNRDIPEKKIESILKQIQGFEPPGVGARDLRECLMLQLKYKRDNEDAEPHTRRYWKTAYIILRDQFDLFSKRNFDKLMQEFDLTSDEMREIVAEITRLNPKPAATLGETQSTVQLTITPDFIVREKNGELILSMTKGNMPELRISDHYRDMLNAYKKSNSKKDKKEKETVQFIKQKIDSAQWFIEAIRQRQQTLEGTMHAIISIQSEFFKSGDEKKMAPMKLKDVAEITGLDESTISRVANSKFVLTEFGTKPLKYFFSESMQNVDGEDVSTMEIKSTLKDLVQAEDKKKPLSDEKLKDLLKEKGYTLARRTVAKYREQLNIPVARLRKNV
jgi:RNA polymerase sigma-54 factor